MLLDEKGLELSIKATQSLSPEYKQKPNIKVDNSLRALLSNPKSLRLSMMSARMKNMFTVIWPLKRD